LAVPEEEKPNFALDLLESYAAWRLGTLRLDGLSIEVPEESTSASIDDLTVTAISSEGIDGLILKGLNGKSDTTSVSLASLELEGFVSPDLEALIQFAALESDIDPKMHADAIRKTFAALPRISHLGLKGFVTDTGDASSFSLDSLSLDLGDWNDLFAQSTDMRMTGLKFSAAVLGPDTAELFGELGYDDLVLGVSMTDRWTPETGDDIATWTFSMGEAGEFSFSYTLTGLTLDWLVKATAAAGGSEDSEKAVKAMLDQLRLKRAAFSVTDRSLLERAFGYAAEAQELDVDGKTYREQMRAALPFLISAAMPPAITKLMAKPLQQFLSGGQTLIAEFNPPAPLNMTEFLAKTDDPLALPDRLNMTLRTETPTE
jgi:hypothetical protein